MSFAQRLAAHQAVFAALAAQEAVFARMAQTVIKALRAGHCVFVAGNGGSAADAQHFAAELTGRFVAERRALAGVALTTDTSALTAIANDYGYEQVFARQLQGLARPGDVFLGISTSGHSPNILAACAAAKALQVTTLGLAGRDGGQMHAACDTLLVVDSDVTAHIQEAHIFLLHGLCAEIDRAFA